MPIALRLGLKLSETDCLHKIMVYHMNMFESRQYGLFVLQQRCFKSTMLAADSLALFGPNGLVQKAVEAYLIVLGMRSRRKGVGKFVELGDPAKNVKALCIGLRLRT